MKLAFAGINFVDVYMRRGEYAKSSRHGGELPMVLGREGAGEVAKVGAGVTEVKPGDRVAWCVTQGAYAEYAVVPAWRLVPVPPDVPLDVACALQLQGQPRTTSRSRPSRSNPAMSYSSIPAPAALANC